MENIFEGAKFGDKFLTRDGRLSLFIKDEDETYSFIIEGEEHIITVDDRGYWLFDKSSRDIISRYQEPIDEEKLDELAKQCTPKMMIDEGDGVEFQWGFIVGYRKAMEE